MKNKSKFKKLSYFTVPFTGQNILNSVAGLVQKLPGKKLRHLIGLELPGKFPGNFTGHMTEL